MIPLRVLAVLAVAVGLGAGIDLLTGAAVPGYGAGIGAAGTVALALAARLLGTWLRRNADVYDRIDTPAPHPDGRASDDGEVVDRG